MARIPSRQEQALLAPGVSSGAYFFLDLGLRSRGRVRVAFGGRERCGENYRVQRSTYPFATLEYVAEGEGRISFGGAEAQALRPGTLFVHGPGVSLRMQTEPGRMLLKYFVCLTGHGARAAIEAHGPVFGTSVMLARHADVRDMFDLLIREGGEHTPFTREICDRLSELLLLKISEARRHRSDGRASPAREKFLRCKTLIDEEAARLSSLEEIASELHAEASGLNRLFRRYQGVSPYQYLLRCKMNLAARDLMSSGGFVKEVAARAGYADPYHFSRVFKAVHGISPAHFLRLYHPEERRKSVMR
jgi:AraC-like DNA-binding protein